MGDNVSSFDSLSVSQLVTRVGLGEELLRHQAAPSGMRVDPMAADRGVDAGTIATDRRVR
jgi:hypothetical protein